MAPNPNDLIYNGEAREREQETRREGEAEKLKGMEVEQREKEEETTQTFERDTKGLRIIFVTMPSHLSIRISQGPSSWGILT